MNPTLNIVRALASTGHHIRFKSTIFVVCEELTELKLLPSRQHEGRLSQTRFRAVREPHEATDAPVTVEADSLSG